MWHRAKNGTASSIQLVLCLKSCQVGRPFHRNSKKFYHTSSSRGRAWFHSFTTAPRVSLVEFYGKIVLVAHCCTPRATFINRHCFGLNFDFIDHQMINAEIKAIKRLWMVSKIRRPQLKLKSFENWSMAIDLALVIRLESKRSARKTHSHTHTHSLEERWLCAKIGNRQVSWIYISVSASKCSIRSI